MGRLSRQPQGTLARPEYLNEQGMIFGASYVSSAVISDGTPPPAVASPVTDYVPSGRPGGRAPHVTLERNDARVSTIDLVGRGFVLLTARAGRAWRDAAARAAAACGMPIDVVIDEHPDGAFPSLYGVDAGGAVLVRPDGYIAWRQPNAAGASETLPAAFAAVLGRA